MFWFSDVFRGYRNEILAQNGLRWNLRNSKLLHVFHPRKTTVAFTDSVQEKICRKLNEPNFSPCFIFISLENFRKQSLSVSGGIEMEHWAKMV